MPDVDDLVDGLVVRLVHLNLLAVRRGSAEHVFLADVGACLVVVRHAGTCDPFIEDVFEPFQLRHVATCGVWGIHAGIERENLVLLVSGLGQAGLQGLDWIVSPHATVTEALPVANNHVEIGRR